MGGTGERAEGLFCLFGVRRTTGGQSGQEARKEPVKRGAQDAEEALVGEQDKVV